MTRFVITHHAVERLLERYDGTSYPSIDQARTVLLGELERGVPFGAQAGNGALYLLPCGLVAAAIVHHGCCFVKTILTREQAIANMESQGAVLHSVDLPRQDRDSGRDNELTDDDRAALHRLAERHFKAGISRKERNTILRERGFDPAGTAGEIYRAAYRALIDDMWAQKREEYWRRHQAS